jgi:glycosyltransferase involved in cell wall biosynthesis
MEKILPQYDAFVMSSFYEGQPVSLLEAMACGLPALLADIPVLREVTGTDAIYFDINDPDSFVAAVQQVLDGKYDLKKMAGAGHIKVNAFAHRQQHLQKIRALYNEPVQHH